MKWPTDNGLDQLFLLFHSDGGYIQPSTNGNALGVYPLFTIVGGDYLLKRGAGRFAKRQAGVFL